MRAIDSLEEQCRKLVANRDRSDFQPAHATEREIAVTLDQLDGIRSQGGVAEHRLDKIERDLKTRILNLATPPLEYHWERWAERTRMTSQIEQSLVRLERQRQSLHFNQEKTMRELQNRLVELWNRREQFGE